MPIIQMADGQQVEVPDNPTPELKERIRAKNEQIKQQMAQAQGGGQGAVARGSAASQPTLDRALAKQEPPAEHSFEQALGNIGVAGLTGAVTGFAAPEVMAGAGKILGAIPYGPLPAVGKGMVAAAPLMAGLGARAGSAAMGAASGITGQGVEEVARQVMPPHYAKTAGLLASMAVPGAERVVSLLQNKIGQSWRAVKGLAGGAEENLSAAVKQAKAMLSSEPFAREPQLAVAERLAKAAAENIAKAKAAGGQELQKAMAEARALQMASATDLTKAAQIKAKADGQLAKISPVVGASDTGNLIRGRIVPEFQGAIAAKNAAYKALETERNAQVRAREAAGEFMDSDPGYRDLVKGLEQKLFPVQGLQKRDVTDPGVRRAYENLYTALKGEMTSFEAVDQVRRRLGEVAAGGQPAEGYAAIGKGLAKEWYAKLSEAQVRYAGPVQKQMQTEYAEALGGLAGFKTGRGKAATAMDRVDPTVFAKDPAALPGQFFKTQQGVRDLKELTRDEGLVGAAARQHTARELSGKDSAQVRKWLADPVQKDWVREVPGLQKEVEGYVSRLALIERTGAKLGERAAEAGKRAGKLVPEAEARAGKLLQETEAKVKGLAAVDFPVEQVNALLKTSPDAKRAAGMLAGTPGGAQALERSMRSLMAGMGEKELGRFWSERGQDIMAGVVSGKALARLDSEVQAVLRAYSGRKALSEVQKAVSRAIAAAAGYGAGQTGVGAAIVGD